MQSINSLIKKGLTSLQEKKYPAALEAFNAAYVLDKKNEEVLENRAKTRYFMNDLSGAKHDLDTLLNINPNNSKWLIQKATISTSDTNLTLELLDRAKANTPDEALIYKLKGQIYLEKDAFKEAINNFDTAIRLTDSAHEIYTLRGEAQLDSGNFNHAVNDFTTALSLTNIPDAYSLALRAEAYYELGEYEDAKQDWLKVIQSTPESLIAWVSLAESKWELQEYAELIELMDEAIQKFGHKKSLLEFKANTFFELKEFDAALNTVNKLIYQDKNNPEHYLFRGIINAEHLLYFAALNDFSQAIRLDTTNYEAYLYKGIVNTKVKDLNFAKKDFSKIISETENDNLKGRAYYYKAIVLQKTNDEQAAYVAFNEAAKLGNLKAKSAL